MTAHRLHQPSVSPKFPHLVIAGRWQFTQVLYEFAGPVPAPWVSRDIGGVGPAGTAATFADKFVVTGAGSDIWGRSDAFRLVYQSAACAASVTARVTSEQPTHAYAKAGVMLRSSLDPSGSSITLDVKPDGGIELLARTPTENRRSTSAPASRLIERRRG